MFNFETLHLLNHQIKYILLVFLSCPIPVEMKPFDWLDYNLGNSKSLLNLEGQFG